MRHRAWTLAYLSQELLPHDPFSDGRPVVRMSLPPPEAPSQQERRRTPRVLTPQMSAVNLGLAGGTSTFTNLRNISRDGLCIARRGRLELDTGSEVLLEIHQPGSEQRIRCRAEVRWCRYAGFNTYIGLAFIGTHQRLLSYLEELLADIS